MGRYNEDGQTDRQNWNQREKDTLKGFSLWVTSTAKVKSTSILKSVNIGPNHFLTLTAKLQSLQ